jgi:type 2 lantibiotic biosynthesis protein LanM
MLKGMPLRPARFLADTSQMSATEQQEFCKRFYQGRTDLVRLRSVWAKAWESGADTEPIAPTFAAKTDLTIERDLRSCFDDVPFAPCLAPFAATALGQLPPSWNAMRLSARRSLLKSLLKTLSDVSHRAYFRWFEEHRSKFVGGTNGFESFIRMASSDVGIQHFFTSYPQLARWLPMVCQQWMHNVARFIDRLSTDEQALSVFVGGSACLAELVDVIVPDADRHRGGQTVLIAVFASGVRIVYKPRSVEIEHRFCAFVEALCELDERLAIPTMRVLSRSSEHYGWGEFIHPCDYCGDDSTAFLRHYHRRAGRLLAHICMLAGRDMHMENIIATEHGPVLIDGECLFQPDGGRSLSWWISASGLLGENGFAANGSGDIGGFTGTGGHVVERQAAYYEATNTASMRLGQRNVLASCADNLPKVAGVPIGPREWQSALLDGLHEALNATLAHRATIKSMIRTFSSCPTRIVLRPSTDYGHILRAGIQPDALAQGWERRVVYEPLIAPHVAPNQTAPDPALLGEEYAALNQLDIPIFSSTPDQRDLFGADGPCRVACFSQTAIETVLDRLAALNETEIELCVRRAEQSLVPNRTPALSATNRWQPCVRDSEIRSVCDDILASVLDRLGRPTSDSASMDWMQSISLYTGKLGIALFCSAAACVLESGEARLAAMRIADECWETWTQNQSQADMRAGAFEGKGSLVLGFAALSNILNLEIWRERSLAVALHQPPRTSPAESSETDLIAGLAGWLAAVAELSVHSDAETQRRLRPAIDQAAQRLASHNDHMTGGFAHGAAGIAFAFGKALAATNDGAYETLMHQALANELAGYDATLRGWVFKTTAFGQRIAMNAWCNGTSGIALALSELRRLRLSDSTTGTDWQTMLGKLTSDVFSVSDHWCCGNGGRLAINQSLALAGHGVPLAFVSEAQRMLAAHYVRNNGLNLDDDLAADHLDRHSLFRGVSGIGFTFLRSMHPELLPDILAGSIRSTVS